MLTDLENVYFSCAKTTQIKKEVAVTNNQNYNPHIQGGITGILDALNSCISVFDPNARYEVSTTQCVLEIHKTLNSVYDFK